MAKDAENKVGENINASNASWTFGESVPKNFTDHISRSVPFYDIGHDLVRKISDFFVQPNSTCYELGVSTGALIKTLATRHHQSVNWVGIDLEPNMIKQAREELKKFDPNIKNVNLVLGRYKFTQLQKLRFNDLVLHATICTTSLKARYH